jgi:hypothetical protein
VFTSVKGILNAASAVMKRFPKAAHKHISGFPKADANIIKNSAKLSTPALKNPLPWLRETFGNPSMAAAFDKIVRIS